MALNFDNEIPEWKNAGVEPSNELRAKGFTGGYKPPATVFNWFWSLVQKCITELQTKLKTHADSTSNPHNVTKAQIGLGKVDNTADKDKNVLSATKLTTARKINGSTFNGTSDITIDIIRYRIQGTSDNRYDLNNVITPGEYWGAGGNFAINFPEYDADKKPNIGGFTLKVYQSGGLGRLQVFINDVCMWFRVSSNVDIESNTAIWKDWICLSKVGHLHNIADVNNLDSKLQGIHKTYYVASSTSESRYKSIADAVINSTDDIATILNNILTKTVSNNTDKYVVNADYDRVYICPGTYNLKSALKISKSNVIIEGCKDSIIKITSTGTISIGQTETTGNSLTLNVKLKGFTIDSSGSNTIIWLGGNSESFCRNVEINGLDIIRRTNVVCVETGLVKKLTLKNNIFYHIYSGTYTTADISVTGNSTYAYVGNGLSLAYPIVADVSNAITLKSINGRLISEMCTNSTFINQSYIDMNAE